MTTRPTARSTVLGALLTAVLVFVADQFGFASASLVAVCVLVVALVADRVRVGSS